ncbi:MAG: hypothetical protein ICV78_12890 [Tolypothrix sp. Co-bin9]|nr:hypothetical protein [Tolypothrix sp. Co-bin9]
MLKIKHWQLNWLGLGSALALMSATIAPAAAEQVIVIDGGGISIGVNQPRVRGNSIYYNQPRVRGNSIYYNNSIRVNQPPTFGNFIYGSPIPTPIPVNPSTGLIPSHSNYYYSHPRIRQNVRNSTFVNPVLVNPTIRNSTLINPTIVRDSSRRSPVRRSRVIYNYPW